VLLLNNFYEGNPSALKNIEQVSNIPFSSIMTVCP
jgi:hypothetical protein